MREVHVKAPTQGLFQRPLPRRLVTAAVLVAALLAALYLLSPLGIALFLGVFMLAAAWEWAALCGFRSTRARAAYTLALALAGALLYRAPVGPVFVLAGAWWVLMLIELLSLRTAQAGILMFRPARVAAGVFVLLPPWIASIYLYRSNGPPPLLLLFVFVLVWLADSAAYFAGRAFGRRKLAPAVSPGKSVEGALAGLAAAVLLAFAVAALAGMHGLALAAWLGLALVTGVFSIVGDLLESRLKRIADVKDSGRVLPGHGGVLDRVDALTAAAPVFALGWWWLNGGGVQ